MHYDYNVTIIWVIIELSVVNKLIGYIRTLFQLVVKFISSFWKFAVATMAWSTVTEYLSHKWSLVCSICRMHNPALSSFMNCDRDCSKSNTTCVASGTDTACPSWASEFTPGFSGVSTAQSLVYYVVFCRSLSVLCSIL